VNIFLCPTALNLPSRAIQARGIIGHFHTMQGMSFNGFKGFEKSKMRQKKDERWHEQGFCQAKVWG